MILLSNSWRCRESNPNPRSLLNDLAHVYSPENPQAGLMNSVTILSRINYLDQLGSLEDLHCHKPLWVHADFTTKTISLVDTLRRYSVGDCVIVCNYTLPVCSRRIRHRPHDQSFRRSPRRNQITPKCWGRTPNCQRTRMLYPGSNYTTCWREFTPPMHSDGGFAPSFVKTPLESWDMEVWVDLPDLHQACPMRRKGSEVQAVALAFCLCAAP